MVGQNNPGTELADELLADIDTANPAFVVATVPDTSGLTSDGEDRVLSIVQTMTAFSYRGGTRHEHAAYNRMVDNTITVATNEWLFRVGYEAAPSSRKYSCAHY